MQNDLLGCIERCDMPIRSQPNKTWVNRDYIAFIENMVATCEVLSFLIDLLDRVCSHQLLVSRMTWQTCRWLSMM